MAISEKIRCKNPSENTITHDRNDYKQFITEDFANRNIVEVQEEDLQEYTQRLVHRLALKKQKFTAYKVVLNLIFGYALRHSIIAHNPVTSIENDVYLKPCDCTKKKAETEIFSAKELDAIHKEMERRKGLKRYQNCFGYDFAVRFAEVTGARAGEIVSLKWDDIDYETKVIHIHTQQLLTHDEDGHIQYVIADYIKLIIPAVNDLVQDGFYISNQIFDMTLKATDEK